MAGLLRAAAAAAGDRTAALAEGRSLQGRQDRLQAMTLHILRRVIFHRNMDEIMKLLCKAYRKIGGLIHEEEDCFTSHLSHQGW